MGKTAKVYGGLLQGKVRYPIYKPNKKNKGVLRPLCSCMAAFFMKCTPGRSKSVRCFNKVFMMSGRLISSEEAGKLLGCSKRKARDLLINHGLFPVNMGTGKRQIHRWLESAVSALVQKLYDDAQPKHINTQKNNFTLTARVNDLSLDDLYALTQRQKKN